jgi:hypothetical protein
MAAGLGFKDFTTGEVLTAADVDGYLMQGIWVFASTAARDAAVTSPQEGNFAFTKDTNSLWYYDGAAWVASGATGDIEGVTAGIGISGGGTSGTVTVTNSMATAIDAKGDLVAGTGADTFAKLTVGANDTVLTADSTAATGLKWATVAAGGGANWSLLNSGGTSLSGSEVSITGISGKDKLMVIVTGASLNSNTGAGTQIRFNSDTGNNYGYAGSNIYPNSASTYAANRFESINSVAADNIPLCNAGDNAGDVMNGYLLINGCNSTGVKIFNLAGAATVNSAFQQQKTLGGFYSGTSTISSVQIRTSSTFDAGTVYIYGSA